MTDSLMTPVVLCGVLALALSGCDDDTGFENDTALVGTSSTGTLGGSSSSTGAASQGSSTGGDASMSSSGGGMSSEGGETSTASGASGSDTGGPGDGSNCELLGGVLITEFEAEFPLFRVGGDDVATAPLGTICMNPFDTRTASAARRAG